MKTKNELNQNFAMKKLLFIALAVFVSSCSKSDANDGTPNFFADTKWELIQEKGYEISGEYRDEWNAKSDDFNAVYVFKKDNTGTYTTYEYINGNMESSISEIRWQHNLTAAALAISFIESGDQKMYKIMSYGGEPMTLTLEISKEQPEYDYKYHNVETYVKK